MKELWKYIDNYENWYMVSSLGNIKSVDRLVNSAGKKTKTFRVGRLLKIMVGKDGYPSVVLFRNSEYYSCRVHSFVANAFVENPNNYPEVNHKNGIKIDNRAENLEWVTRSQNIQHAWDNGLRQIVRPFLGMTGSLHHTSKSVSQFDFNDKKINTFGSIKEAERITGIPASSIGQCANGKMKKARNYIFKFNK